MCSYSKSYAHFSRGYRASETRDEQTETPTPKDLPQYVADQVVFDIVSRKRHYAMPEKDWKSINGSIYSYIE